MSTQTDERTDYQALLAAQVHQLDGFVAEARKEIPSSRRLLAIIHRGDLITHLFSKLMVIAVCGFGLFAGLIWLYRWYAMFHELERWSLVISFFDQLFLILILYVAVRITVLRSEHLRKMPSSRFISLRAASMLARWIGDIFLVLAFGYLGHAFLGVPLTGMAESMPGLSQALGAVTKLLNIPFASLVFLGAFVFFVLCYAAAAVVDVLLSIEQNTRGKEHEPTPTRPEVAGGGQVL